MPIRAVFFDAGFTLLAPSPGVAEVYLHEARALGCDVDEQRLRDRLDETWATGRFHPEDGFSSDDSERESWRRLTRRVAGSFPDLLEEHDRWLARLFAHFDDPRSWRVIEGAHDTLEALRGRGIRCAVASNWHTALHPILAAHGLDARVEFTLTSAETGRRKPHPAMFETALERMGVTAAEAAHVGDSIAEDVDGARAAGLRAIHFAPAPAEERPVGFSRITRLIQVLDLLA